MKRVTVTLPDEVAKWLTEARIAVRDAGHAAPSLSTMAAATLRYGLVVGPAHGAAIEEDVLSPYRREYPEVTR